MNDPVSLRYSRRALRKDILRAAGGLAMCVVLLLLVEPLGWAFFIVLLFAAVFVAFGAHVALKRMTRLRLDEQGVRRDFVAPGGRVHKGPPIEFSAINRFTLRYYGRQRDRGKGIIELTVGSPAGRFTADQSLHDFDKLVILCRAAARARGLTLDRATAANLAAFGYE